MNIISNKVYIFSFILFLLVFSQLGLSVENKFSEAGFDNPDRVTKFLIELQESVKNNKRRHIATMILFPFTATVTGKDIEIDSMDNFLKNYDQIFNFKVRDAILQEKVELLSVSSNGIMIGRGEVWFVSYTVGNKKVTVISTINN